MVSKVAKAMYSNKDFSLQDEIEDKLNMHLRWLKMVADSMEIYLEASYHSNYQVMIRAVKNVRSLARFNIRNKKAQEIRQRLDPKIRWVEESLNKIYKKDNVGHVTHVNKDLIIQIDCTFDEIFEMTIKMLDSLGILKFLAKDPGHALADGGE